MFIGNPPVSATARKSKVKTLPLPLKGWNAKDSLADMEPEYAALMDNVFPDARRLVTRGGSAEFATGMTDNVESLMVFRPDSGAQEMFAANDGNIYDITAGGAVGAAVASGFGNDRWQSVNIGTSGGRFLFAVNGQDTAQIYDGATWADSTLTGPNKDALVWCNLHQRRLWTGESGSLSAWYGGTNAITGGFTEFPMYGIADLGGYLMGMATWTRDAGDGQDDVAVFVTSEGQAIVYSGIDPSDVSTWAMIGVFRIGKPIGRRFFIKAGGDCVLITDDGFVSLASVLALDRAQADKAAISAQINPFVNEVALTTSANFGWEAIIYPSGKMIIFNVPIDGDTSHQYVFNTLTKAACRFTGWDANCWALFNDGIYFGGKNGKVYQADSGTKDSGSTIECTVIPAFSELTDGGMVKQAGLAKIIFESGDDVSFSFKLLKNYALPDMIIVTGASSVAGSLWDSALWDASLWGGRGSREYWRGVNGIGTAFSLAFGIRPNDSLVYVNDIKLTYQTGGILR